MLEDLLYEGKGKVIGSRILNTDEYKIEHSTTEEENLEILRLQK
jgi:hypothetical protein